MRKFQLSGIALELYKRCKLLIFKISQKMIESLSMQKPNAQKIQIENSMNIFELQENLGSLTRVRSIFSLLFQGVFQVMLFWLTSNWLAK